MAKNKAKLKEIFDRIASPEEKAIYALKDKVKKLEQKPVPEKVIEKTEVIREVEKEVTGEYIVLKVNELEAKPEKQIDFVHIKNFPWHLVKGSAENGLISWGGGSLSQTLDLGNTTGGFDIVMSDGDLITGSGGQISLDFGNDAFFALTTDGGGFNTPYFTINPTTFSLAGLGSGGIDFFLTSIQISHATLIQFNSAPVRFNALTASTVPYLDASKNLVSSAVTPTELGYLSGVTSAIQTQLDSKEVPLTFGDGLTRTANDIDLDTTVNILKISGLTSNGFVKTSGGDGTLSVDTGSYQPLDATLTAFAALTIAADSLSIGTGADAFSQTTFAANTFPARASTGNLVAKTITDFGLSLVDDTNAAAALTTLGLDADLATFSLPASTTISTFGASLIDDAAASNARTTLGLGTIATEAETNYALLAGRSGGQTLIGGTGTTDDLILQSTSGVGTTGADIIFKAGNNGATEVGRMTNDADWWINGASLGFSYASGSAIAGPNSASFYGNSGDFHMISNGYTTLTGTGWKYMTNGTAANLYMFAGDTVFRNAASGTAGNDITWAQRFMVSLNGNVVVGSAALATNAANGFLYIPTCAGAPTGTPTAYTGRVAMVFDTTNNKLMIYDGGWIGVALA